MVLGKLPVPGRPTNLDYSWARAYCTCSSCGWGLFGIFFSRLSFLILSPSLWETAQYRLKYCLKGPLSPKQPTNTNHLITNNYNLISERAWFVRLYEEIIDRIMRRTNHALSHLHHDIQCRPCTLCGISS